MITTREPYKAEPDTTSCCHQSTSTHQYAARFRAPALALPISSCAIDLLFRGQGNNKKPDAGKLQDLLKPTGAAMEKMESLKDRRSKQFNHLAMVAEGGQCLQWVCIEPTPAPYLGDVIPASEMYSNKVFPTPCLECGDYIRRCVCGATRVFFHSSFSDAGMIFAQHQDVTRYFSMFWGRFFLFSVRVSSNIFRPMSCLFRTTFGPTLLLHIRVFPLSVCNHKRTWWGTLSETGQYAII
jgi:hypothetical protein